NFGRCREHLDVRYLAVVPDGTPPVCSEESEQVAWWPVDALPEGPHGDVADLVRVALRTLAALRV
ncbi:MAG: NUDIX hydrolase, partial [Tetrasphaera sp.]|nr:NUDIX hydrolase [Tetrasphaera sp.]